MSLTFTARMPHALEHVLRAGSFLAPGLWAGAIAGCAENVRPDLMILLGVSALASTNCAAMTWRQRRLEAQLVRGLATQEHNQMAMAAAMELMAGRPLPLAVVPSQPCEDGRPGLRAVH